MIDQFLDLCEEIKDPALYNRVMRGEISFDAALQRAGYIVAIQRRQAERKAAKAAADAAREREIFAAWAEQEKE